MAKLDLEKIKAAAYGEFIEKAPSSKPRLNMDKINEVARFGAIPKVQTKQGPGFGEQMAQKNMAPLPRFDAAGVAQRHVLDSAAKKLYTTSAELEAELIRRTSALTGDFTAMKPAEVKEYRANLEKQLQEAQAERNRTAGAFSDTFVKDGPREARDAARDEMFAAQAKYDTIKHKLSRSEHSAALADAEFTTSDYSTKTGKELSADRKVIEDKLLGINEIIRTLAFEGEQQNIAPRRNPELQNLIAQRKALETELEKVTDTAWVTSRDEEYGKIQASKEFRDYVARYTSSDPKSNVATTSPGTTIGAQARQALLDQVDAPARYSSSAKQIQVRAEAQGTTVEQELMHQYLNDTQGSKKASDYRSYIDLTYVNPARTAGTKERAAEAAEGSPVRASILSSPMNIAGGVLGSADIAFQNFARLLTGSEKPVDYNTDLLQLNIGANTIRAEVAQQIADSTQWQIGGTNVWSFLYQTGMSMADSAVVVGLTAAGVPNATALLGASAATTTALDIKATGGSDAEILFGGLLAGVAETFFEKYSIESLMTLSRSKGIKNIVSNLVKQSLTEGSEEFATSIANTITDTIVRGNLSDIQRNIDSYIAQGMNATEAKDAAMSDWVRSVLSDTVAGMISGFGMASAHTGVTATYDKAKTAKQTAKDTKQTGAEALEKIGADELINAGLSADVSTEAYALASKLKGKKSISDTDAGKLSQALTASNKQLATNLRLVDMAMTYYPEGTQSRTLATEAMATLTKAAAEGLSPAQAGLTHTVFGELKNTMIAERAQSAAPISQPGTSVTGEAMAASRALTATLFEGSTVATPAVNTLLKLGIGGKAAAERGVVLQKILNGQGVTDTELDTLDVLNRLTQRAFTSLTGVDVPEGVSLERAREIFREASRAVRETRAAERSTQRGQFDLVQHAQEQQAAVQAEAAARVEAARPAAEAMVQGAIPAPPTGEVLAYEDGTTATREQFKGDYMSRRKGATDAQAEDAWNKALAYTAMGKPMPGSAKSLTTTQSSSTIDSIGGMTDGGTEQSTDTRTEIRADKARGEVSDVQEWDRSAAGVGLDGRTDSGRSGRLQLSAEAQVALTEKGVVLYELKETTDSARFVAALEAAKLTQKFGASVSSVTEQDIADRGLRLFLLDDGSAGCAVAPDGDMVAAFKNKDAGPSNVVPTLLLTAINNGGTKLDCYGIGLVMKYSAAGFVPVARVEFNPEYKPADWADELGTPDVYVMVHNGDSADTVAKNFGQYKAYTQAELDKLPNFGSDGYDAAMAYRDMLIKEGKISGGTEQSSTGRDGLSSGDDTRTDVPDVSGYSETEGAGQTGRAAGPIRQSAAEIGVIGGTDTKSLRVIPKENYTNLQAKVSDATSKLGANLVLVDAPMTVIDRGAELTIDGIRQRNADGTATIFIHARADLAATLGSLNHESFHQIQVKDPTVIKRAIKALRDRGKYAAAKKQLDLYYKPVYGEAYNNDEARIWAELLADAYAGLNSYGATASMFKAIVRSAVRKSGALADGWTIKDAIFDDPTPIYLADTIKKVAEWKGKKVSASALKSFLTKNGVSTHAIKWSGIEPLIQSGENITKEDLIALMQAGAEIGETRAVTASSGEAFTFLIGPVSLPRVASALHAAAMSTDATGIAWGLGKADSPVLRFAHAWGSETESITLDTGDAATVIRVNQKMRESAPFAQEVAYQISPELITPQEGDSGYDNYGKKLTKGMAEYMKDSVMREGLSKDGRLINMYRGSRYGHQILGGVDKGPRPVFWTSRPEIARTYTELSGIPSNARLDHTKAWKRIQELNDDWVLATRANNDEHVARIEAELDELHDSIEQYSADIVRPNRYHDVFYSELNTFEDAVKFLKHQRLLVDEADARPVPVETYLEETAIPQVQGWQNFAEQVYDRWLELLEDENISDALESDEEQANYIYTQLQKIADVAYAEINGLPSQLSGLTRSVLDIHDIQNRIYDALDELFDMPPLAFIVKGDDILRDTVVFFRDTEDSMLRLMQAMDVITVKNAEELITFNSKAGQNVGPFVSQKELIRYAIRERDSQSKVIYEVYLNLKNPYIYNGAGEFYHQLTPNVYGLAEGDQTANVRHLAEWARDNGYDSLICTNVKDSALPLEYIGSQASTIVVTFADNPEVAKSTANAQPTTDPRLAYQISPEQWAKRDERARKVSENMVYSGGMKDVLIQLLNSEDAPIELFNAAEKTLESKSITTEPKYQGRSKDVPGRESHRARAYQTMMAQPAAKGKRLDLVTGLPGAGKSSVIANKLLSLYGGRLIDSDAVKEILPGFDSGRGNDFLSAESSDILTQVANDSFAEGANMVWPTIGRTSKNLIRKIQQAKDAGYEVYLHHVEITPAASLFSTLTRAFPDDPARPYGQYVPVSYLRDTVQNKPNEVFEELKAEGVLPSGGAYNFQSSGRDRRAALPVIDNRGVYSAETPGVGAVGGDTNLPGTGAEHDDTLRRPQPRVVVDGWTHYRTDPFTWINDGFIEGTRDYSALNPSDVRAELEARVADVSGDTSYQISPVTGYPVGGIEDNILNILRADSFDGAVQTLERWVNTTQRAGAPVSAAERVARVFRPAEIDADTAQQNRQQIDDLIQKYGRMNPGEKEIRAVPLPKKVAPDRAVSRTAQTMATAELIPEHMQSYIEQAVLNGELGATYTPITDKAALAEAEVELERRGIVAMYADWEAAFESGRPITKHDIAKAELMLINVANAKSPDVGLAMKLIADIAAAGTRAGQVTQAMSLLKKMTPSGQLYYLQKAVDRMNKDLAKRINRGKTAEIKIDPELARAILEAQTREELDAAFEAMLQHIADQTPVTMLDKWNAWRYLSMLGNPRTHIRNIFGNAIFTPALFLKDLAASGLETAFVKDSKQRTKMAAQMFKRNEYTDFAANDYLEVRDSIVGTGKYNPADQIRDHRKIFKSKATRWINTVSEFNFMWLEKEDAWFLKRAYVSALSQYLAVRGVDVSTMTETQEGRKLLNQAREYAIVEAQKATYRDYSAAATALNRLKRVPGIGILTEGLVPFTKTPINILKRGVEYSPVGLLRSITLGVHQLKSGKVDASQFIDQLASGLTGSGITILGMLLTRTGLLIGGLGGDDKDKFAETQGQQEYSIQIGDTSYTVDWTAPVALPLFVGAEVEKLLESGDLSVSTFSDALTLILEPMFSLSMLDGLNRTLKSAGYSDSPLSATAISMGTSYLGQAVPTLAGQVARTVDDTRRTTYIDKNNPVVASWLSRFWQSSVLAKIPVASKTRAARLDEWGRADTEGNVVLRAFENFISPGYINLVDQSAMEEELTRLYESTDSKSVLPSAAAKYFNVGGVRKDLTADEYEQYGATRGQAAYVMMTDLVNSAAYASMADTERASAVEYVYTYATQTAKHAIAPEYKMDNWIAAAQELESENVSVLDSVLMKTATAAGENIYEAIATLPGASDKTKSALMAAQYNAPEAITDPNRKGYELRLDDAARVKLEQIYQQKLTEAYPALVASTRYANANEAARLNLLKDLRSDINTQARKELAKEIKATGVRSTKK